MKKTKIIGQITSVVVCMSLILLLNHCFGNLKNERDQAAALKKLKRGELNKEGLYHNEFFEFDVTLPKSWIGTTGDPPIVLTGIAPEKEIINDNARKFIDIQVQIMSGSETDTLDTMIDKYIKSNNYEITGTRNPRLERAEGRILLMNGRWKENSVKLISLLAFRDKRAVVVQCRALRPLYDNVESQFSSCLSSFKVTSTDPVVATPTATPNPYDYKTDFINYTIQQGDTPESIASRFMGSEQRSEILAKQNESIEWVSGSIIQIPRFMTKQISETDTYESISEEFFQNQQFASWIKDYNTGNEFSVGSTLYIPLYEIVEPLPREEYLDISKRIFNRPDLVDTLLIYNDAKPLNMLTRVRIPFYLRIQDYSYVVQSGDTLANLAGWLTGDPKNYSAIGKYNKIAAPYTLTAGQVLKIPPSLVKDPSVFKRPRPKPKATVAPKPSEATPSAPSTSKPTDASSGTPVPATPVPSPQSGGIYEPD